MFDVRMILQKDNISGEFIVDSYFFEPSKYDYAFRLIEFFDDRENENLAAIGYSDSKKVIFELPETSGKFYVRCFLRDKQAENVRGFNSEKIIINI